MNNHRERMREIERGIVLQTVMECGGNLSEVARKLGMQRQGFEKLLDRLNIDIKQIRKNFKTAEIMDELRRSKLTREELVAKYTHTHCMERVPGGITGTHTCGNKIPLGEKLCDDCKKILKVEFKSASDDI
jgi:hypothetical protein